MLEEVTHAMDVDRKTVEQIARLARIRISENEADNLQSELTGILTWVEQLNEVSTEGVEPMTQVVPIPLAQRDDIVTDGEQAEAVVANAPMTDKNFFVVPKVTTTVVSVSCLLTIETIRN